MKLQGTHDIHSVLSPANKAWDYQVKPFKLPPYVRLVLADVDAGSDTPSLVGKVLKWRQSSSDQGTGTFSSSWFFL